MLLFPPIEKLGSIPVSRRTPEDREKDIDDFVRWLRNGKDDSDDPTVLFRIRTLWKSCSIFVAGWSLTALSFAFCLDPAIGGIQQGGCFWSFRGLVSAAFVRPTLDHDSFFGLDVVATSFCCFPDFSCLDDSVV